MIGSNPQISISGSPQLSVAPNSSITSIISFIDSNISAFKSYYQNSGSSTLENQISSSQKPVTAIPVSRDGSRDNYAWASDFCGPRSIQVAGIAVAHPTTHQICRGANDETTASDHV